MIYWLDQICLVSGGAMLMMSAIELLFVIIMPGSNRYNRRFFIAIFTILLVCMCDYVIDLLTFRDADMAFTQRITSCLEYILVTLPMPIFTVYMMHCCGEDWRKNGLCYAVFSMWGIFFIMLGIAQFTTFFYYVTPKNEFCRGSWHPLMMFFALLPMLLNLVGVIRRRDRLPGKYYAAFLFYLIPLAVSWFVHTVIFVPELVFIGVSFSEVSMVSIIMSDQLEQYMLQQQKIAHQRANIMMLQMRPHFIYNTMTSIYYLCAQDPQKAQVVTLDFTTYLRKNFTAIVSTKPIPFSDELEHTRAYLAVEQVQFKDSLFVDYDTPHTSFRVPPLTLQPIVENAVKHGMDPEAPPLRIFIRTRKTDLGSEIIVEDNGSGFDPSIDDSSEPHIALSNIRQRLEMMCNGEMMIMSRDGGGTVVKVTIP